jgi:hypothetical protein
MGRAALCGNVPPTLIAPARACALIALLAEQTMTVRPNSVEARDVAHVLHPYTNASLHEKIGPVVITRGEGIYVLDNRGNRDIGELSGLFCASPGFREERLVEAARGELFLAVTGKAEPVAVPSLPSRSWSRAAASCRSNGSNMECYRHRPPSQRRASGRNHDAPFLNKPDKPGVHPAAARCAFGADAGRGPNALVRTTMMTSVAI